jgi:transcriptional repressor NF-X1
MVDREPHRSVQLIRRIDTRVPANLLSQAFTTGSTLGKLADLRAPVRISPAAAPASSGALRANRGWNSVLTASQGGNPPVAPSANSQIGPGRISRSTTPSQALPQLVATTATKPPSSDAVPDNWEDES